MPDPNRTAFLRSALDRTETRLKLAVARAAWREAIDLATEAAALDEEIKTAGTAEPEGPRNIVSRVKARG